MKEIRTDGELSAAVASPAVILFKHSPRCYISRAAWFEVDRFSSAHPEVAVLLLDVIASRSLSQTAANLTGVRHESPQVLFLRRGEVTWHDSHEGITEAALEEHLALLTAPD